jgi:hypothetical protein
VSFEDFIQKSMKGLLGLGFKDFWAYYPTTLTTLLFSQLKAWAEHRHPNKSSWWSCQKYWQTVGSDNWVFKPPHQKIRLLKHRETPIVRHIQVQGSRSPFDGDWVYWSSRMGFHPEVPKRVATLLRGCLKSRLDSKKAHSV